MDMDLTDLLTDPDLGAQEFAWGRITEAVNNLGRAEHTEVQAQAEGIVQPAPGRECERLPEGDRAKSVIVVYTQAELCAGQGERKPDRIYWRGGAYRVALAEPWWEAGGYIKVLAVLEQDGEVSA